ncbi:hypothetical protein [Pseudomonas fluorescens]|uniref:Uncharacterized protein n=1 Tax=Pseudomonas fluorescens TaxID=294 RepID=A0A5E7AP13_PSEFL|nr:hypothetical protein [Pseudomonas fluorescens]VVN78347.1 hypothetical protein PS691_00880 [Pseudomonas fluorescens]
MTTLDTVSTGALLVMGIILLVLLLQYLRLREIWQLLLGERDLTRWARIWETENRELRSALRAEKAQVEELEVKLTMLQASVPTA